jgi:hypothetical protein
MIEWGHLAPTIYLVLNYTTAIQANVLKKTKKQFYKCYGLKAQFWLIYIAYGLMLRHAVYFQF